MRGASADKDTSRRIAEAAELHPAFEGQAVPVISLKTAARIAKSQGISLREVAVTALKQGIIPLRYLRNVGTLGLDGQIKLLQSTVAVVGAGGLGSVVIELLTRQGLGHLTIIDSDRFTEPNLNRQVICTEANLGKYKAPAAARRIKQISSATEVTVFREKLMATNAPRLLSGAQVVVDGLDNLSSRLVLEQACRQLAIPYVYASIAGLSGQLMTIFPQDPGLSSIYGLSSKAMPERGIETRVGNPPAIVAVVAALQAQEAVKIITGVGTPVRKKILLVDVNECTMHGIEVE